MLESTGGKGRASEDLIDRPECDQLCRQIQANEWGVSHGVK